jgi:hypothetical protein
MTLRGGGAHQSGKLSKTDTLSPAMVERRSHEDCWGKGVSRSRWGAVS